MNKYYVITFLGEDISEGAFCSVCGVFEDLQSADIKMEEVIKAEENFLNANNMCYEKSDYGVGTKLCATTGDWSYTIELQIVDKI